MIPKIEGSLPSVTRGAIAPTSDPAGKQPQLMQQPHGSHSRRQRV
jgi:hypothetical protein